MPEDIQTIPVAPAPELPPAAVIVKEGTATERELELQKKLDAAEAARKKAETDAAYTQDENRRLKELQTLPVPHPAEKKRGFVTLLHDPED